MREDKEWQAEYMPKIRTMVTSQDNIILNKFPWAEFSQPPHVYLPSTPLYSSPFASLFLFSIILIILQEKSIWELRQYTLKPGSVPVCNHPPFNLSLHPPLPFRLSFVISYSLLLSLPSPFPLTFQQGQTRGRKGWRRDLS